MNFNLDLLIYVPQIVTFDYLIQPSLLSTWVDELDSFEFEGDQARPEVAGRFRQTVRQGGSKKVYSGRVETYDPPRELSVLIQEKRYDMLTVYRLRPNELGTQMRVITKFFPKDRMTKFLGNWSSSRHRKRFLANLKQMKTQWEEAYAAQSPPQRRTVTSAEFLPGEPRLDPVVESADPL